MAQYKYGRFLNRSDHSAYDELHPPGTTASNPQQHRTEVSIDAPYAAMRSASPRATPSRPRVTTSTLLDKDGSSGSSSCSHSRGRWKCCVKGEGSVCRRD